VSYYKVAKEQQSNLKDAIKEKFDGSILMKVDIQDSCDKT